MSTAATAPALRAPTTRLATLALIVSFLVGGCAWACNYGPLASLALAITARVLVAKRPDRHAGAGRATVAIVVSLIFTVVALTLRPYVGSRGDLRYGSVMDGIAKSNRPMQPVGPLRSLQSAEHEYSTQNGGFYDTPKAIPELREWPGTREEQYFAYTFHPGRAPTPQETAGKRVSPSSMVTFAVTVAPKSPELPSYCTDSTFTIRTHRDGRAPKLVDGLCDPAMLELR